MDALQLVPFEDSQVERVAKFDASEFHIKVLDARTYGGEPREHNGERHRSRRMSPEAPAADYGTSENEAALVPVDPRFSAPYKRRRKVSPAEHEAPEKRAGKRETHLPSKYRDVKSNPVVSAKQYKRYSRRGAAGEHKVKPEARLPAKYTDVKRGAGKPKVKRSRLPAKFPANEPQYFDVPITSFQADGSVLPPFLKPAGLASSSERNDPSPSTPSRRRVPAKPELKRSDATPTSGRRGRRRSRAGVNYAAECTGASADGKPRDGRRRTPNRNMKLNKKSAPASSDDNGGTTVNRTQKRIHTSPDVRKANSTGTPERRRIHTSPDVRKAKSTRTPHRRIPIRKLKGGYISEDDISEVEGDLQSPGTYPTFMVEMKYSNVITCFWLSIPSQFCSEYLPDHDKFIVLQDSKGLKWETNYLARKRGLSGGWRRFAVDHGLVLGDVAVFELVKPLKLLVHITRVSEPSKAVVDYSYPSEKKIPKKILKSRSPAGAVTEIPKTIPKPRLSAGSVRETPKKIPKPRLSTGSKKNPSLYSALFSARKRVIRDNSQTKVPTKKPRLASTDEQQQEDEDPASVSMTPSAKPNTQFSSETKRDRPFAKNWVLTENSSDRSDHYVVDNTRSGSEESQGEEEPEIGSLSKFKRLSDVEETMGVRNDAKMNNNDGEGVTAPRKSQFVSGLKQRQHEPRPPKAAPSRNNSYELLIEKDVSVTRASKRRRPPSPPRSHFEHTLSDADDKHKWYFVRRKTRRSRTCCS